MDASVQAEVAEWAGLYAGDEVDLGHCLCDAHAECGADALLYDGPEGRVELSYAELRERSQRLAGALREAGVEPGDRVATLALNHYRHWRSTSPCQRPAWYRRGRCSP